MAAALLPTDSSRLLPSHVTPFQERRPRSLCAARSSSLKLRNPLSAVASPRSTPISRCEEERDSAAPDPGCSYASPTVGVALAAAAAAAAAAGAGLWSPEASSALEPVMNMTFAGAEPSNALSLPTWIIHVASVVEWMTAIALVWKYGETEGKSAWKGLAWGMVPLLGGAFCACTWHFFYNAESLEVLVVLQAFLTVVGNFTMWAAAYRIWQSAQESRT